MAVRVRHLAPAVGSDDQVIGADGEVEMLALEHFANVEFEAPGDDRDGHPVTLRELEELPGAGPQRYAIAREPGHFGEPVERKERDLALPSLPEPDLSRMEQLIDLVGDGLAVRRELLHQEDRDVRFDQRPIEVEDHVELIRGTRVLRRAHGSLTGVTVTYSTRKNIQRWLFVPVISKLNTGDGIVTLNDSTVQLIGENHVTFSFTARIVSIVA